MKQCGEIITILMLAAGLIAGGMLIAGAYDAHSKLKHEPKQEVSR